MKSRSALTLLRIIAPAVLLAGLLSGCGKLPGKPAPTIAPPQYLEKIYLPGTDDKLHLKAVSHNAIDSQIKAGGSPVPALDEVITGAPKYFPPGTRIKKFAVTEKSLTLDLNSAFANSKHWSQGETTTQLAVYALVNSAALTEKDGKKPVQLTVEGKPLSTLGEFDASDPIEPDQTLIAK